MSSGEKYQVHLRRQIGFLTRSCQSYDAGGFDESIRIATVLRVLIHDTGRSTSLLRHLNATNIRLIDTCPPLSPNAITYHGMGMHKISKKGSEYYPNLGMTPFATPIPVKQWWEQIVMIIDPSTRLRRKDIILTAANKDGGAHVDQSLTPEYEALANDGAIGFYLGVIEGEKYSQPISNAHLVCIRQMGHEVLNSSELLGLIK